MTQADLKWKIAQSQKVIRQALKKWPSQIGIAFTGGKDSTVLTHLVKSVTSPVPPLMFIDHRLHFDETYAFCQKLVSDWGLVMHVEAEPQALKKLQQETSPAKKRLLSRELKIKTIEAVIKKYKWQALMAGIRWDEHPARSTEDYFSSRPNHTRIHPILHFTEADIWSYIKQYKLPYNPLYDQGYRSIGEKPFTKPVRDPNQGERGGREKDKEKIMERLRSLGYF